MANPNVDPGLNSEVYNNQPIYFRVVGSEADLYGMAEYRAGYGEPPSVGHHLVLRVLGIPQYTKRADHIVYNPPNIILEGVFEVVDVKDNKLQSSLIRHTKTNNESYWDLTVIRIGEIDQDLTAASEDAELLSFA